MTTSPSSETLSVRRWFGLKREQLGVQTMNDVIVLVGFKAEDEAAATVPDTYRVDRNRVEAAFAQLAQQRPQRTHDQVLHRVVLDGHLGHDAQRAGERVDGVEQRLLVFLVVLVVGERLRLHEREQAHEVAVDAAGLAARHLAEHLLQPRVGRLLGRGERLAVAVLGEDEAHVLHHVERVERLLVPERVEVDADPVIRGDAIARRDRGLDLRRVAEEDVDLQQLEKATEEAPVVKLVNYLLYNAVRENASDIHIEPMEDRLQVRFREDGVLNHFKDFSRDIIPALVSRLKIMCQADITEKRLTEARINQLAYYDALTNLPNSRYLRQVFEIRG